MIATPPSARRSAAARLDAETAVAALLPAAESLADVAEHAALTAKEIAVFRCRPGRLSTEAFEIFKRPEYVPSASRGKSRGGSDSDDDTLKAAVTLRPTLRASQMAAASAKGKGRLTKSAPKELDKAEPRPRVAQFKEEAETRARARDVVDQRRFTCDSPRASCAAGRDEALRRAASPRSSRTSFPPRLARFTRGTRRGPPRRSSSPPPGAPGTPPRAVLSGVPETFAAALRLSARCADSTPPPVGDGRARRFKTRRGG